MSGVGGGERSVVFFRGFETARGGLQEGVLAPLGVLWGKGVGRGRDGSLAVSAGLLGLFTGGPSSAESGWPSWASVRKRLFGALSGF